LNGRKGTKPGSQEVREFYDYHDWKLQVPAKSVQTLNRKPGSDQAHSGEILVTLLAPERRNAALAADAPLAG
jgi:hypothetical protein